jgi:hypothetical protein
MAKDTDPVLSRIPPLDSFPTKAQGQEGPVVPDSKVIAFSRYHSGASLKIPGEPERHSTNEAKHDLAQRDAIIAEIENLKVW